MVFMVQVNSDRQQQEANQEKNEQNVQNMEQAQRQSGSSSSPSSGSGSSSSPSSPQQASSSSSPPSSPITQQTVTNQVPLLPLHFCLAPLVSCPVRAKWAAILPFQLALTFSSTDKIVHCLSGCVFTCLHFW